MSKSTIRPSFHTASADYGPGQNSDGTNYPGDVSCGGVDYTLDNGGILRTDALPRVFISGSTKYGWNAFLSVVPADVYIVDAITCGSVTNAAGCAPVGGTPRVVLANGGINPQVFVHEHIHTLGLGHSNMPPETVCPTNYKASQEGMWRRIMYCRVNPYAKGLSTSECNSLGGQVIDIPVLLAEDQLTMSAEDPTQDEAEDSLRSDLDYLLEQPFPGAFTEISDSDINYIRSIISERAPIDLLRGAVLALGEKGEEQDARLLFNVLEDTSFKGSAATSVKTSIPPVIYSISSRLDPKTSSIIISRTLSFAELDRAREVAGDQAEALSVQAVVGLGNGGERALPFIDALIMQSRDDDYEMSVDAIPEGDEAVRQQVASLPEISIELLELTQSIAMEKAK